MGDFGPAYYHQSTQRPAALRCAECGLTMPGAPAAGAPAHCPSCGGELRAATGAGANGAGRAPPPSVGGADALADAVLSQIVSPALLEALAGTPSRPTDATTLAELPRERIEPYAQLLVRRGGEAAEAEPVLQLLSLIHI